MKRNGLNDSVREARKNLSYLGRALAMTWQAAPRWMIAWAVLVVVQGLLPAATVVLTKYLVDAIAGVLGAGLTRESGLQVAVPAALMGGVLLLGQLFGNLLNWVRTAQAEHVTDRIKAMIHEKAVAMDLAFYETPDRLDQLLKATSEAGARSLSILQSTGTLIQNAITLIGISVILLTYSVLVPVILVVSTVPAMVVVLRHNRRYHRWWDETTEKRRWERYYDLALTSTYAAPEIRTLNLAALLRARHDTLRKSLRAGRLALMRRQTIAQFGASLVALAVTAGTLVWIGLRSIRGTATLGDLALFYQAFNQGQALMRSLLSGAGQMYSDTLFVEHLFSLLEIRPEIRSPESPRPVPRTLERGIDFRDVSFTYPGSESPTLANFDLEIPAGKTVAVVGPNGAGKSTLIKLLCRLYDPQQGSVSFDGTDIREFSVERLRERVTVMFQLPVQWIATVAENIYFGDVTRGEDREVMERAVEVAGADRIIDRLPAGYATLLSKQFSGGAELSGGQWQRIALARAFYRDAPVVVLDEPTSFMDSWEEVRWLERFDVLVRDRTALIVTHRFTTAMHADLIHVMDEGRVVESGSHDELVALDGFYASSWKQQQRLA